MTESALLQEIFRREGRSLLQYVSEAFPWATQGETEALAKLQMLVQEERDALAELSKYLRKQRIAPPYFGAFPMSFTNINYIALDHLLPMLADDERRGIAHLEKDLMALHEPGAREQVRSMLTVKQRHLEILREMGRKWQAPATPTTV